jgi:hypothetical protein
MEVLQGRVPSWKRTLLALAALSAGAGCAGPLAARAPRRAVAATEVAPAPRDVEVVFDDKGCPVGITPDALDCDDKRPMCFTAFAKRQHQVKFHASPAKRADGKANDYELQFDPFADRSLRSTNGAIDVTVDVDMPKRQAGEKKVFPYNVLAAAAAVDGTTCEALDPEIIIVR